MSTPSPYTQLEQEWRRLHAFHGALALLRWDAAVMMPRGSADVRGEQLAALETETHALLTQPKITRLLDRAQANAAGLEDWQLANLREMRRARDHAIATPASLISRLARATSRAEQRWAEARRENNFELFASHLEEVVHLVRDKAALLGQALGLSPYDALVDEFSPGVATADIDSIFKALSRRLPTLIREALSQQAAQSVLPISGKFAVGKQRALVLEVMRAIGFPFERGRLDESEHPFTEGVPGDIRVTTRFDNTDVFTGLLGAMHETGHAMYDLGLPQAWRDQPVGRDRGMALEESQSLLLEMPVGRSRAFLVYLRPLLEKHFAVSGPEWEPENLYRRLTHVQRSLIRVDADELTYPLHSLLRYDLEKKLLSGELKVRDLPEAWSNGMEHRLEVRPTGAADGCLQDIHWALGSFGYFPSYVLGAVISAQLWESLRSSLPELEQQISRGEFGGLFGWLRENVHSMGAKVPVNELMKQATGQPLSAAALLRYLEHKFLEGAPVSLDGVAGLAPAPALGTMPAASATLKRLGARLRGLAGKAIEDFRMIERGDRVMVCLSGGKDSYTMLDLLRSLQRSAPVRFELIAVNLDQKQPGFPARVLPDYLESIGVSYHVISQDTYRVVKRVIPEGRTMCGLCSRLRRGALYRFAAENDISKIALGHHRDDIVETLFLNLFHGGRLKAMAPKLRSEDGRHIVIRPLAYICERDIARYAAGMRFPLIPCTLCGSQPNLQRQAIKRMLKDWEREQPGRLQSIFSALRCVEPETLADPRLFDFRALSSTATAATATAATAAARAVPDGHEPAIAEQLLGIAG